VVVVVEWRCTIIARLVLGDELHGISATWRLLVPRRLAVFISLFCSPLLDSLLLLWASALPLWLSTLNQPPLAG